MTSVVMNKNNKNNKQQQWCTIGLDVGTQGTKGILYHLDSKSVIARASASYSLLDQHEQTTSRRCRAEQHPDVWERAVITVIRELMSSSSSSKEACNNNDDNDDYYYLVKGIGVSGQQHGMVVLDRNYKIIRPAKLWCDLEASVEAEELSSKIGREISPGYTAPKVMWMKKHEPQNYDRMKYCVLPHDYINFLLTGGEELTTDAGDASGTGVFDVEQRKFSQEWARLATDDDKYYNSLPRVLGENESAGLLCLEWKNKCGININEINTEVIVSAGSGDNMCSALGSGCVKPGTVVLSLGTSGTIFGVSTSPVRDMSGVVNAFCDATGNHLPLICVMSCTAVLQQVLKDFCHGLSSHAEAEQLAKDVSPGCDGLTFIPYLSGERTPSLPTASGSLLGLTYSNLSPGHIYRAALEGITYNLFNGLEEVVKKCPGFKPASLLCVGGGSKNKLWGQIISDVFNLPLQFPTEAEAGALGAAFQAGAVATNTSISDFVAFQDVKVGDLIMSPNTDEDAQALYQASLRRYNDFSFKLYCSRKEE